jgi:hypothetical protein
MRENVDIAIPEKLREAFESLPDVRWGGPKPFTQEEDAALLKYWPVKVKSHVARVLGRAEGLCRKRYNELVEGKDAGQDT